MRLAPGKVETLRKATSVKRYRLPGLAVAFLIGLLAARPLFGGVPKGVDTLFHWFRLVQLDALVQNGILFSRWAPDLAYGFGYPIFNYYSPFTYYVAELLHLTGFGLIQAFLATHIIALVGASVFMYLWLRDLLGDAAALVAATIYVFAPYVLFTALWRGALAELVALALFPLILWAFRRLWTSERRFYAIVGTLAYATLILTHNVSALIFTPVLFAYILILAFGQAKSQPTDRLSWMLSLARSGWLLILGLGISAFYWIPAVLERDLVKLSQAYAPQVFNFDQNFLSLPDLLALPFTYDPNLVHQNIPISLSLVALIATLLALIGIKRFRANRELTIHIWFAILVIMVCLLMTLSLSGSVWELLPFLQLAQFPWRFLGIATLFIAFLSGVGVASLLDLTASHIRIRTRATQLMPILFIAGATIYVIPWQFTPYLDLAAQLTVEDSIRYELDSGYIGTTSTGEYLPLHVKDLPLPDGETALLNQRLDLDVLPEGAQLLSAEYDQLTYRVIVDSPLPYQAVFKTFFFEGWQAKIDGQSVPIVPVDPHGLIGLDVPARIHELQVQFETTQIRQSATFISLISLILFIGSLFLLFRRQPSFSEGAMVETNPSPLGLYLSIAILLAVILVFEVTYVNNGQSIFSRSRFDGQKVDGLGYLVDGNFENQLILMGADIPSSVPSGGLAEIKLYWRIPDETDEDYSVSLVVLDDQNRVVGQHDNQHAGPLPTSQWLPSQYAIGKHEISLLPGMPPGTFELKVIVYETGQPDKRLDILDQNGNPAGQSLTVGTLVVDRPDRPAELDEIAPDILDNIVLKDEVKLIGHSLPSQESNAGENVQFTLFWQAVADLTQEMTMEIGLNNNDGKQEQIVQLPLVTGYPTSRWERGDIWRANHQILLNPTLPTGNYTLTMAIAESQPVFLGSLHVIAPEHLMELPETGYRQQVSFDDLGQLQGYDVPQKVTAGESLPVTLIWRSLGETRINYRSFVQLLDANGKMVVGSDVIPGDWRRPTTGWISDEYIVDPHALTIPPDVPSGKYQVLVGLYNSDTKQRLRTGTGDDAVVLSQKIEVMSFTAE